MKSAGSDYSFSSSDGTPELFQKTFPCDVSSNFSMGRTKVSYTISDGLGPYFRWQPCEGISQSGHEYTIQYDETGNSQNRKQCDLLVHYWSEVKNEINVRFLKTLVFGHVKGCGVATKIMEILQEPGLSSLSSDGPNINNVLVDEGFPDNDATYILHIMPLMQGLMHSERHLRS